MTNMMAIKEMREVSMAVMIHRFRKSITDRANEVELRAGFEIS